MYNSLYSGPATDSCQGTLFILSEESTMSSFLVGDAVQTVLMTLMRAGLIHNGRVFCMLQTPAEPKARCPSPRPLNCDTVKAELCEQSRHIAQTNICANILLHINSRLSLANWSKHESRPSGALAVTPSPTPSSSPSSRAPYSTRCRPGRVATLASPRPCAAQPAGGGGGGAGRRADRAATAVIDLIE